MRHIVINSGGIGTRFWPASRKKMPKQLISFTGDHSLLRETFNRNTPLVPQGNIHVATTESLLELTTKELPELAASNAIIEPMQRNTAPAMALATWYIAKQDPQATIAFVAADHYIPNEIQYQADIERAFTRAESSGEIVLIGVPPAYPSENYGYIKVGSQLTDASLNSSPESSPSPIYDVEAFREKPNKEVAEGYTASGKYVWNAGMFIATADTLKQEFARHMPALAHAMDRIQADNFAVETILKEYEQLDDAAIDIGIIEKTDKCSLVKASFIWDDLGSWSSVQRLYQQNCPPHMSQDDHGNITSNAHTYCSHSSNCLVQTTKPIAIVGLEDIVIIEKEDVLLVVSTHKDQKIKDITQQIPDHLK